MEDEPTSPARTLGVPALGTGARQGVPLVVLGGASVGVSSWMLAGHVQTFLGRLSVWPWLLTIGAVLLVGGLLCSFLDWDASPENTLALDDGEIVVPRAEWERWLRVKLNLAAGDDDGSYSEGPRVAPDEPAASSPEPVPQARPPAPAVAEPAPPAPRPVAIAAAPEPEPPAPRPAPMAPPSPAVPSAPLPSPPVQTTAPPPPTPLRRPPSAPPRPAGRLTEGDLNETIRRLQSIIAAEKLLRGMGDADAYIHEVESEIAEVERLTGIPRGSSENSIDYCSRLLQRLRVPPKPTTLTGSITPTVSDPARRP